MVPPGWTPTCHKMLMRVTEFVPNEPSSVNAKPAQLKKISDALDGTTKRDRLASMSGYLTKTEMDVWAEKYFVANLKPKLIRRTVSSIITWYTCCTIL